METRDHLYTLFNMLSIDKLIFLAPEKLRNIIHEDACLHEVENRVTFINGNDIIPFSDVEEAYERRINEISESIGRPEHKSSAGWYYQQFLKMAYCNHCDNEYYLTWDADTIPLRPISMFHSSGAPYLFTKTEYMASYFKTLKNSSVSIKKVHMLIKTILIRI